MNWKIRWSSVLASSVVIALITSATLFGPLAAHTFHQHKKNRAAQPHPVLATEAQQRQILRAVLQETTFEGIPPPPPPPGGASRVVEGRPIVLLNTSTAFCGNDSTPSDIDWSCADPWVDDSIAAIDFDTEIPRKLRQELVLANRRSTSIPDPGLATVMYRPPAMVKEVLSSPDGWSAFYALFPDSAGFVEASRAVLSHDGTHALVYVAHRCDGLCGTGTLHYVTREGSSWRVASSIRLWVS